MEICSEPPSKLEGAPPEREHSEAAVDRLALADQSAGHVSAHGGKLRALPASDGKQSTTTAPPHSRGGGASRRQSQHARGSGFRGPATAVDGG